MSAPSTRLLAVALLPLAVGACSDFTTAPAEAAQLPRSPEYELLVAVIERLDRMEEETAAIRAQLERSSSGAQVSDAAGAPPEDPGRPEDPGGGGIAETVELLDARTDSIMQLVQFIAEDVAAPLDGIFVCGGVGIGGEAELKTRTQGDAEASGGVGVKPWDTGALAQVEVTQRLLVEFGVAGKLEVGLNGCLDLTKIGEEPPVSRSVAPALGSRSAAVVGTDQLETTLLGLTDRLGLSAAGVSQSLMLGADVLEAGDFSGLTNLRTVLPAPPVLSDPLGLIRQRMTAFEPVDILCGGGQFGPRIQSRIDQACSLIQDDNLPDLTTFLDLGNNFTRLQSRFSTACSRVNSVLGTRLVVDVDLPWEGTALNVPLFPNLSTIDCAL